MTTRSPTCTAACPDGKVRTGFLPETTEVAVHGGVWCGKVNGGAQGDGWAQAPDRKPCPRGCRFVAALVAARFSAYPNCG